MPDLLAKDEVIQSWDRSREAGVDAEDQAVPYSSDFDSDSLLIAAARPILTRLNDRLRDEPIGIALADASGRVVQRYDPSTKSARILDRVYLAPGFDYREERIGTNAIGTALASAAPVRVDSAQHYRGQFSDYVCVAAPVRDPRSGEIVGVVDLSCLREDARPYLDGLVRNASTIIEHNLAQLHGERHEPMLLGEPRRTQSGPFAARSPLAQRFCATIEAELAMSSSLLVLGESGIGKVRIVMQAFNGLYRGGVTRVVPVERLNGDAFQPAEVARLVRIGGDSLGAPQHANEAMLVVQNVHLLAHSGVKNLLALAHAWQAEPGHRPVVATADERELADDAPVLTVHSYFDRVVQLPQYRPDQPQGRPLAWLEQAEYTTICRALNQVGGNRAKAATLLGIARSSLYRKMRQYGIDPEEY